LQEDKVYYLLFHTIHEVLKAEKILKKSAIEIELVPVPRRLSSDCGICIKSKVSPDIIVPLIKSIETDQCLAFDGTDYTPSTQLTRPFFKSHYRFR
jgi:hypothetical protein